MSFIPSPTSGGTAEMLPAERARANVDVDVLQKISAEGLSKLGPTIEKMALAEGLEAHKNAVSIRLKSL